MRPTLLLLGGVTLLLLAISCATVSNALLVRAGARGRELAVRAALGANPRRLLRQLLTEGLLLSAAGAALGIVLAAAVAPIIRALIPLSLPRGDEVSLNRWLLAFVAGIATLTSLAPAREGIRLALVSTLARVSQSAPADRSSARWRRGIVGTQSAIATALLISACLLLISFWRLGRVPLGFDGGARSDGRDAFDRREVPSTRRARRAVAHRRSGNTGVGRRGKPGGRYRPNECSAQRLGQHRAVTLVALHDVISRQRW